MNLGFWITWFRYQKLKIFPFEYQMWGQKILLREGYSPSSRGWFEGFFLDQGLNQKLLKWGIELKKDIESWRGGWIIINDRIFSTPNKENETLQLHPPSDFFPFFRCKFLLFFLYHHAWILELQPRFFLPHLKGSSWPYGRKENSHTLL